MKTTILSLLATTTLPLLTHAAPAPNDIAPGIVGPNYDYPSKSDCAYGDAAIYNDFKKAWLPFATREDGDTLICQDAGPGHCQEIGASGTAVVSWCNDNTVNKCLTVSDLNSRLINVWGICGPSKPDGSHPDWSGQAFFGDSTNVIVRHS